MSVMCKRDDTPSHIAIIYYVNISKRQIIPVYDITPTNLISISLKIGNSYKETI